MRYPQRAPGVPPSSLLAQCLDDLCASRGRSLKSTEKVLWGSEPEVGNTGEPIQASPKVRALVDRLMVLRDQDAANKAVRDAPTLFLTSPAVPTRVMH